MRTAEEILHEEVLKINESEQPHYYGDIYDGYATAIYNAINVGREECIKECAKRAKIIMVDNNALAQQTPSALSNMLQRQRCSYVDRQSILKLIKELK